MHKLFSLALVMLPFMASAQADTSYYSDKRLHCTKDSAIYFDVTTKINDTNYVVDRYITKPFWHQSTEHYKSVEPIVYHGEAMYYYKNGDTVHGHYTNDAYTGEVRYFYDLTQDTLQAVVHETDGKLHGTLVSYYPNGKVKRRARYFIDRMVQGNQYNEKGEEVTYTPLMTMPEPTFDLNRYLAKKIKYPKAARAKDIEGRVMVQFIVDKEGKIKNSVIVKEADPLLNAEALRVVNNMKLWKPGIFDDKPVDVYFTLPMLFKLE